MKTTALLFSTLLLLTACSKPDSNNSPTAPPLTNIRIATVTEESTDYTLLHTLHYNADTSRVDSIITTGDIPENLYFTYTPSYTLIKHKQPDRPNTFIQDSVLFDAAGRRTASYNLLQSVRTTSFYSYKANGELDRSETTVFYDTIPITDNAVYTWSNGDLVSQTSSLAGTTTTYSYSSSAALPGNPAHLPLLLKYGELQVSTAHLLTGGSAMGTTGNVNYVFSNGRIASYTRGYNLLHNPQKVSFTYLN